MKREARGVGGVDEGGGNGHKKELNHARSLASKHDSRREGVGRGGRRVVGWNILGSDYLLSLFLSLSLSLSLSLFLFLSVPLTLSLSHTHTHSLSLCTMEALDASRVSQCTE